MPYPPPHNSDGPSDHVGASGKVVEIRCPVGYAAGYINTATRTVPSGGAAMTASQVPSVIAI
ncbi:hypothetical protein P0W64_05770 [Tsukamurella sp. 8F]|uniref:hypothetical protein n=1 Tax=Tsukamurella sp. 8F TaxID=3031961 RepID=UPI0023B951D2|nr:hypothetical protein [Tsukamurella sp. 8F]MDF0586278.1 hypothetical protein [Tsukamurella sp. 8F]